MRRALTAPPEKPAASHARSPSIRASRRFSPRDEPRVPGSLPGECGGRLSSKGDSTTLTIMSCTIYSRRSREISLPDTPAFAPRCGPRRMSLWGESCEGGVVAPGAGVPGRVVPFGELDMVAVMLLCMGGEGMGVMSPRPDPRRHRRSPTRILRQGQYLLRPATPVRRVRFADPRPPPPPPPIASLGWRQKTATIFDSAWSESHDKAIRVWVRTFIERFLHDDIIQWQVTTSPCPQQEGGSS